MVNKIAGFLVKPINVLAFTVTLAMVVLVVAQVIFRYVLSVSVPWTEEVARVFFVWMIFMGTCLVEEDGSQVRTLLFVERFSRGIQIVWECVVTMTSILFQILLFVGSLKSFHSAAGISLGSLTWITYEVFFIPVIIASPVCVWFMINNLIIRIRKLRSEKGGTTA